MTILQIKKIKDVQAILREHGYGTEDGLPASYIYKHYVRDRFYITERQMRNYADMSVRRLLIELEKKEAIKTGQMKLDIDY